MDFQGMVISSMYSFVCVWSWTMSVCMCSIWLDVYTVRVCPVAIFVDGALCAHWFY